MLFVDYKRKTVEALVAINHIELKLENETLQMPAGDHHRAGSLPRRQFSAAIETLKLFLIETVCKLSHLSRLRGGSRGPNILENGPTRTVDLLWPLTFPFLFFIFPSFIRTRRGTGMLFFS